MANIADRIAPRRIEYKRVKMTMPHCPVCKAMLVGNNSIDSPYRCQCGVWENELDTQYRPTGVYKIRMTPL